LWLPGRTVIDLSTEAYPNNVLDQSIASPLGVQLSRRPKTCQMPGTMKHTWRSPLKVLLKIWRQDNRDADGKPVDYPLDDVDPDMSFLDILDMLNEQLVKKG